MNRIVRTRYPVEQLPKDLRDSLDPSRPATVIVEQPTEAEPVSNGLGGTYADLIEQFRSVRERLETERRERPLIRLAEPEGRLRKVHGDGREVVDHIRAMRDDE
ncbi:hypothetical protein [Salinarimonas soli]|uniref:Uncharacterized protein n=1 Tax=Salinarimonas soli TaxID=1638099 RepID=A0A5B2VDG2_9HYPH|nr:hypothetical protein [Salinarimonas soli]KAA2236379.1 hypothetical protein F0L46_14650 [Salinarimonas soli]